MKIKTASLIFTAFVFRMLFVNIGVISSLNTLQNKSIIKAHFSPAIKKRKHLDKTNNMGNAGFSVGEICEEVSDKGKKNKLNPFILIQILCSSATKKLKNELKQISPFCNYISNVLSDRYLKYEVFRI